MDSGKHSNPEPSTYEDDRPVKFPGENTVIGRSYDCAFCKRGFTNAQALGGHMNIHRKDKAKAKKNSKETTPLTSNFKEVYINPRYFSTTSSEVPRYDHHYEAIGAKKNNYQVYIPPSNSYQHGYQPYNLQAPRGEQPSMHEDHGDLSLGLNFFPHVEYGERRKENEDDNEVDLELRLGHHR